MVWLAWGLLGLFWGSNFIFMKWATDVITPLQVVTVRIVMGFLPIFLWAALRRELSWDQGRHAHHFLFMALLAAVIYYYGFVRGTDLLPSGIAGAISGAVPLFATVAALMFVPEERLTRRKLAGLALGFLGVLLIARPWQSGLADASVAGAGWILLGAFSLGVSFTYARRFILPLELPPAALTTWQLGIASGLLLLLTPLAGLEQLLNEPRTSLGLVLGLGLCGTGLAYMLYYFLIRRLGVVRAASATYLPPVIALLIGVGFVGEPIGLLDVMGTFVVLCGVLLIAREKPALPGDPVS